MKRLLTLTLLLFALFAWSPVPLTWAAVVCGNETSDTTSAADPSTMSYTPDAGSDRVVIVHIATRDSDADNTTVASVSSDAGGTWNLYGSTVEESSTADMGSWVYYSTDFADGAQTLTVDYTGALLQGSIVAYTCTGVRTSNPWRGTATTSGSSTVSTSVSISVPSAVGDLVVDAVAVGSLDAGQSPTVGASQTEMYNLAVGTDNMDQGGSTEPGAAGNVTMSWSAGTTEVWASVGGSLVPAAAGRGNRRGVHLP